MLNLLAAVVLVSFDPGFAGLTQRCAPDIHPVTMTAVVRHESGFRPLVIGLNYTTARLPRQPATVAEAEATARWLDLNGFNFDSGLGQVNSRNRAALGMTYSDLFDPCANLLGASRVLADCYRRAGQSGLVGQPALHGALSCYGTGSLRRGLRNGYVASVARVLPVPALAGPVVPELAVAPIAAPIARPARTTLAAVAVSDGPAVVTVAKPAAHLGEADVFGARDAELFAPTAPPVEAGRHD